MNSPASICENPYNILLKKHQQAPGATISSLVKFKSFINTFKEICINASQSVSKEKTLKYMFANSQSCENYNATSSPTLFNGCVSVDVSVEATIPFDSV